MKQVFVMLKPDCIRDGHQEDVLLDITNHGFHIAERKEVVVDEALILEHYKEVIERINNDNFKANIIKAFVGKKVIALRVEQDNDLCVYNMRMLVGVTEPKSSDPKSIRGKYSKDSYEIANAENRILENVIHASDSDENAAKEIKLWFN